MFSFSNGCVISQAGLDGQGVWFTHQQQTHWPESDYSPTTPARSVLHKFEMRPRLEPHMNFMEIGNGFCPVILYPSVGNDEGLF
jgi:hypothetical protein